MRKEHTKQESIIQRKQLNFCIALCELCLYKQHFQKCCNKSKHKSIRFSSVFPFLVCIGHMAQFLVSCQLPMTYFVSSFSFSSRWRVLECLSKRKMLLANSLNSSRGCISSLYTIILHC